MRSEHMKNLEARGDKVMYETVKKMGTFCEDYGSKDHY